MREKKKIIEIMKDLNLDNRDRVLEFAIAVQAEQREIDERYLLTRQIQPSTKPLNNKSGSESENIPKKNKKYLKYFILTSGGFILGRLTLFLIEIIVKLL